VLEGAAATMFTVSLLSNKVVPKTLVEPLKVCVAVNVWAVPITAMVSLAAGTFKLKVDAVLGPTKLT